ncbi:hypothetical protein TthWC1_2577 [Thermoanaerobacter thermohydrosulfuricus WC1]|jgi:hypothetical protein|uniref:Uncharacterized protein n=2 Tax=Thermoanaerobacter TaxID=1754 RepID=D3T352_THEIA|nr:MULTISPECIES: helix-turn-helix domain-containing protein [Thermoanaerobacter]ADD02654.1 conserved hypothetical protein [Thermoanaerobacter italicus Ab9]EMT37954.1 hypothetical protein TthWC1_2577 [Thermoanaerobacter thermohydrosulfuricus WC1]
MPAGYSTRCKVCNSLHRVEIEKWAKEDGLSPRAISAKLKEEFGEQISHKSIWQHLCEHFDVKAEARKQYKKSQQQMETSVKKALSDLQMLDFIAQDSYELHQAVRAWLDELIRQKGKIPKTLVDLYGVTASEVRQQLKQKSELLGDDPMSRLADGVATWAELVQAVMTDEDE